jgi:hypothetical protein
LPICATHFCRSYAPKIHFSTRFVHRNDSFQTYLSTENAKLSTSLVKLVFEIITMAKKRFHYLIAKRDDIHPGDSLGLVRKWKISGEETLTDIISILLTDFLPRNPPKRTETWILFCNNLELAVVQQNGEEPILFVTVEEKISKYFDDKGDFAIYAKCLFDKDQKEKYFHDRGIQIARMESEIW